MFGLPHYEHFLEYSETSRASLLPRIRIYIYIYINTFPDRYKQRLFRFYEFMHVIHGKIIEKNY